MLKELQHLAISTRSLPFMGKAVGQEFIAAYAGHSGPFRCIKGSNRGLCRRAVIEEISDRECAELFLVAAQIKTDLGVPF